MLGTIGLFVLFVLWHVVVVRSGNLQFWHLASANPDVAYDWFLSDDTWTIVDRPEDLEKLGAEKDDLVGPFTLLVPKLGREVTIYADPSRIETSQRAFMAMIGP